MILFYLIINSKIPLEVIHYYVMFKLKQKKILFKTLFSNKTWPNFECLCAIVLYKQLKIIYYLIVKDF